MTAFDTAWALLKNEPFFHCPNCNLKDEYHNSRDGSIFCRGCGRYFVADLEGNWQEYDRGSDLGDLMKAREYVDARDNNGQATFYAANMNKGQNLWYYFAVGNRIYRRPK